MDNTHPYNQLVKSQQSAIAKSLQESATDQKTFNANFRVVVNHFTGTNTLEMTHEQKKLADTLNAEAEKVLNKEDYQKNYEKWKESAEDLTSYAEFAQLGKVPLLAGGLSAALAVYGYRKSPVLAIIPAICMVACYIFGQFVMKWGIGLLDHATSINALTVENRAEFSASINQNYTEMEKKHFLLRRWIERRKTRLKSQDYWELTLLLQEIQMLQQMKSYGLALMLYTQAGELSFAQKPATIDLQEIITFFKMLESVMHRGKMVAGLFGVLSLCHTYVSYVLRAHFLVVIGLTNALFFSVVAYKVHKNARGIALVLEETEESRILEMYNAKVANLFLPPVKDLGALHQFIAIPLSDIFQFFSIA